MNGFVISHSSTKTDNWDFSFCLPALHGCPFFKQWIKSSLTTLKRFHNVFLVSWDQTTTFNSIILFLEGGFIFPPSVNLWTASLSHWSYNTVILALNSLFQNISGTWIYFVHPPGTITLFTFIFFKSFLTISVIWHS